MKDEYKIDKRSAEDIADELARLAAGYTPEWSFDREKPDIGGVIALIFAKQMADGIDRLNSYPKRCRLELANMTGIGQMPPRPARMQVVFKAVPGQEAVLVQKGMGIIADTPYAEQPRIVFELCESRYITSADISCVLVSDSRKMSVVRLYDGQEEWRAIDFGRIDSSYSDRKCLELFHPNLFAGSERQVRMRLGNSLLSQGVLNGDYSLFRMTDEGPVKAEALCLREEELVFTLPDGRKAKDSRAKDSQADGSQADEDGEGLTEIMLVQNKPEAEDIFVENISFIGTGDMKAPEYIYSGKMGQQAERFFVFGGSLNLYSECYIGMDDYFRQKGARIGIVFELEFEEYLVGARPKEEEELKLIKRKSRLELSETAADSYAERVIFEYMSPAGWKRLEPENPYESERIFQDGKNKRVRLDFLCPKDWEASEQEGYRGRCLRMVLIKSEFCYFQPCRHHLPVISDIKVEYSYEDNPQKPSECWVSDQYTRRRAVEADGRVKAFSSSAVYEDAFYIGLDRAPAAGPVSLYVELEDTGLFQGIEAGFEYSSPNGFMPFSVEDRTYGGRVSGSLVFIPPEDFCRTIVGGKEAYFIRIIDRKKRLHAMKGGRPVIKKLYMNAVEAVNIRRLQETEFYIERPAADMHFNLGADNIYEASVWVNETENFSSDEMKRRLLSEPERYRAQREPWGEIKSFFVKWNEAESFFMESAAEKFDGRVYVLDRSRGELIFGDGAAARIPKVVKEAAFLVEIAVCDGVMGNVPKHSVVMPLTSQSMIASVDNPCPAYGGADIETVGRAVRRAMGYISSGKRLVTKQDYEQAALAYSANIVKAKCLAGESGKIELVLLMKDCGESSLNFFGACRELKEYLLQCCELTVAEENIIIRQPFFVELSVNLWIKLLEDIDGFTLKGRIIQELDGYLDSVSGKDGDGWRIGELPTKEQILMKLGFLIKGADITEVVLTARYSDEDGIHEAEPEALQNNPYVVVRSGVHTVNIARKRQNGGLYA